MIQIFFSKKNVVSKLSKIYKAKNNKENDGFFLNYANT